MKTALKLGLLALIGLLAWARLRQRSPAPDSSWLVRAGAPLGNFGLQSSAQPPAFGSYYCTLFGNCTFDLASAYKRGFARVLYPAEQVGFYRRFYGLDPTE